MGKKYRILSFVLILTFIFSTFSVTAFAKTDDREEVTDAVKQILSTYYYSSDKRSTDFSIEDPYAILDADSHIDSKKLIPIFSTNTTSKDKMLELCQKIKDGEHLADLIDSDAQLYTITTDSTGSNSGYAIVGMDDFSVLEFGDLNEYTQKDFRSINTLQEAVINNELNPTDTKMLFCVIENFSTGALLYDSDNEYFVPTVEGIESTGILEVGEMYLVSDVFNLIKSNIDTIFPQNEVDENGNPYLGGGIPSDRVSTTSMQSGNSTSTLFLLLALVGFVGLIICISFAHKKPQKTNCNNKQLN